MNHWLVKSEALSYSWQDMEKDKKTCWNGVRNFQANNYLRSMEKGDKCFFYHSGEERAVMGIIEVVREFYPDEKDETGKFGMVDVKLEKRLKTPVTLAAIKNNPALAGLPLIKQSRLSVMPVGEKEWAIIMKMAG